MQNKSLIIGVTGGTGVGKSTICTILKKWYGAFIIDADNIAHNVLKKGEEAYNEVLQYFGNEILSSSGEIDRKKLGEIVFKNKSELKKLEEITHKYILLNIDNMIEQAKRENIKYIVIDAPLLIETNLHKKSDSVWLIDAPLDIRIKRLKIRDNASESDILKRINAQNKFDTRLPFADVVIQCDGKNDIKSDIKRIIQKL